MISLTDKAVSKIKELADIEGLDLSVRVRILASGCAGFSNDMNFDSSIGDMDEVIEQDGIKIICDPISFMYLENCTIDYLDGVISSGFKFINPAAKTSCGCGKSMSF